MGFREKKKGASRLEGVSRESCRGKKPITLKLPSRKPPTGGKREAPSKNSTIPWLKEAGGGKKKKNGLISEWDKGRMKEKAQGSSAVTAKKNNKKGSIHSAKGDDFWRKKKPGIIYNSGNQTQLNRKPPLSNQRK